MPSILTRRIKQLIGHTGIPPVSGVADAKWYDAAYRATLNYYEVPYWHSQYYPLWCILADRVRRDGLRHVLDIGCGPGQLSECLFELGDIDSYTGLDFSPQAIAMARRACPRGVFELGDATATLLHRTARHDVVICTEVLEHVTEDHHVVGLFTPGIRCLCTVPNFPYASHVRHFRSAEEVFERYSDYFDSLDVMKIRGYMSPDHEYFLLDGRRNTRVSR